jgi:hypothetical protein
MTHPMWVFGLFSSISSTWYQSVNDQRHLFVLYPLSLCNLSSNTLSSFLPLCTETRCLTQISLCFRFSRPTTQQIQTPSLTQQPNKFKPILLPNSPTNSNQHSPKGPTMSSASASASSTSSTLPISFNISHLFNTPMDQNTYLCWKSQFEDIFELHDLKDVVSADRIPPSSKLPDGTLNPEYSKDKLVLSWIRATSSPSIQILLISCSTACEAWALLDKQLSPLSKIHLRTLRD